MEVKHVAQSKTVWLGVAQAALGLSDLILGHGLECSVSAMDGLVNMPVGILMLISGTLQVYVRFKTDTKITIKKQ